MYWYISLGNSFELVKYSESDNDNDSYNRLYVTGDFNGDGRGDLMNFGFNFYNGAESTDNWNAYYSFNNNFEQGFVKHILNGLNQKITINYQPITHKQNYDEEKFFDFYSNISDYTFPLISAQIPLYCVYNANLPDGNGSYYAVDYSYGDAVFHIQGKGFLGFKEFTTFNTLTTKNKPPYLITHL
ncbi:MAG: hypothetical protein HC906_09135 [Bacteroidales bacterium]|nr:hypothetical protein [Bacteroidales bacterium]